MAYHYLKFKSTTELWEFKRSIKLTDLEINFSKLTIICKCDSDEIDLAIKKFNAQPIENPRKKELD